MWSKKFSHFLLLAAVIAPAYVLPYPGQMPGNKVYSLKQIVDNVAQYWAFGSFARHKYELALADKKLVEAKILFEYQQYPLALAALQSSNSHFQKAIDFLNRAGRERKNISQKSANLRLAAAKHREALEKLKIDLPEKFAWQVSKGQAKELDLKSALEEALKAREI